MNIIIFFLLIFSSNLYAGTYYNVDLFGNIRTTGTYTGWNNIKTTSDVYCRNMYVSSTTYSPIIISTSITTNILNLNGQIYDIIAGDNLGTHIATMTLNMSGYSIINVGSMTATGHISGTHKGDGTNLTGVNADKLNSQYGSYYQNVDNMNAGLLAIARGGSNNVTYTTNALLKYDGTKFASSLLETTISTSGHTHNLNDLGGVLNVPHGGTGVGNWFSGGIIYSYYDNLLNATTNFMYDPIDHDLMFGCQNSLYSGIHFFNTNSSNYLFSMMIPNPASPHFSLYPGVVGMNIGIGTYTPEKKLTIFGNPASGLSGEDGIRLYTPTDASYPLWTTVDCDILVHIDYPSTTYLKFNVGASNILNLSATIATVNGTLTATNIFAGGYNVLTTNTDFSGDVSGKYNSTVVADDSHNHTDATIADDLTISSTKDISTTGQLKSTVATGTAPLTVNSTTKVTNLNSDLIDGYHIAKGTSTLLTIAGNSSNDTWYSYGITFTTPPTIILTWQGISGTYNSQRVYINGYATNTQFQGSVINNDASSVTGYLHWIAIGN